jgi:hypothetical protein
LQAWTCDANSGRSQFGLADAIEQRQFYHQSFSLTFPTLAAPMAGLTSSRASGGERIAFMFSDSIHSSRDQRFA